MKQRAVKLVRLQSEYIPDLELAGPIEGLRSNFVAGIKHMPVRLTPKRATAGEAARALPGLPESVWLLIETALT